MIRFELTPLFCTINKFCYDIC